MKMVAENVFVSLNFYKRGINKERPSENVLCT